MHVGRTGIDGCGEGLGEAAAATGEVDGAPHD